MGKAGLPRELPARIALPSGRIISLRDAELRGAFAAGRAELSMLEILEGSVPLAMQDVHVLRAMLRWVGLVEEPPVEVVCENCGESTRTKPSDHVELGPFFDGELEDPELDRAFPFGRRAIGPIFTTRGIARTITVEPRYLDDLRTFWSDGERSFDDSRVALVAAGLVRIGPESRAGAIHRALSEASDARRDEVLDWIDRAVYVERLTGAFLCAGCGARVRVHAPAERSPSRSTDEPPSRHTRVLDAEPFERIVDVAVKKVFARRGVRNIDVFVDDGVPWVDDGGEPLLACYTPFDSDDPLRSRPEIRLFLQSFRAEAASFADFDVAREVLDTIDHEVEHHLGFLAGEDPLDHEERFSIARDEMRRVGKSELLRRESSGMVRDAASFLRATWPLWLGLLAYALLRERF